MKTWAKVAIGCGTVVVLAGVAAVAMIVGGAWWVKGKVEKYAGAEKKIEELHRRANANPFTPPADGVIREARLQKFLEVRKLVYAVYEKHKPEIEAMSKKKQGDLGDVARAFSWVNEIREAQAQALADVGVSEAEYRFLVENVYKTGWAAEIAKAAGTGSVSEAMDKSMAEADKSMEEARKAMDQPGVSDEQKKSFEESAKNYQQGSQQARQEMQKLDVPKENLELFRKYEADIKKYAMSGLEWIGL